MGDTWESDEEFDAVHFEEIWKIPNWEYTKRRIRKLDKESLSCRNGFEWKIGLTEHPMWSYELVYSVTLLQIGICTQSVQTLMYCSILHQTNGSELKESSVNKMVEENETCLLMNGNPIPTNKRWHTLDILDSDGSLHIKIRITAIFPKNLSKASFRSKSFTNMRNNQVALLNDSSSSDITILTSDGEEIPAHKLILQAQCPVFYTMISTELSGDKSKTIEIKDISGKTMHILLKYFYTGELDECWSNDDVIVEFTYAAGKYHMTDALLMLDEVLDVHTSSSDGQTQVSLLKLAQRLCLTKAENKLRSRIKSNVLGCNSTEMIFRWFSFKANESLLETEKIQEIMPIWEETLSTSEDKNRSDETVCRLDILLLNHAKNKGLQTLEAALLKRITTAVYYHFKTTDELLGLFDHEKQQRCKDDKPVVK